MQIRTPAGNHTEPISAAINQRDMVAPPVAVTRIPSPDTRLLDNLDDGNNLKTQTSTQVQDASDTPKYELGKETLSTEASQKQQQQQAFSLSKADIQEAIQGIASKASAMAQNVQAVQQMQMYGSELSKWSQSTIVPGYQQSRAWILAKSLFLISYAKEHYAKHPYLTMYVGITLMLASVPLLAFAAVIGTIAAVVLSCALITLAMVEGVFVLVGGSLLLMALMSILAWTSGVFAGLLVAIKAYQWTAPRISQWIDKGLIDVSRWANIAPADSIDADLMASSYRNTMH